MAIARITNVLATTLDKMKSKLSENVVSAIKLWKFMDSRGSKWVLDGSNQIYCPLGFAGEAVSAYTPDTSTLTLGTIDTDAVQSAAYDWTYAYTWLKVSGKEKMINMGDTAVVNLVNAKIDIATKKLAYALETQLFTQQGGNWANFLALTELVTADGTGTVGGLAHNAAGIGMCADGVNTMWQNKHVTGQADYSDLNTKLLELFTDIEGDHGKTKIVIMHSDIMEAYERGGMNQGRFMDRNLLDVAFANATYKGLPIIHSVLCKTAAADECVYMLDTDYMGFFVHKDRNIFTTPFKESETYVDMDYAKLFWMGGMWLSSRRAQGVAAFSA